MYLHHICFCCIICSDAEKKTVRTRMANVDQSTAPVEVDPAGNLVLPLADSTGKQVTCEDFEGGLDWNEFEDAPEDNVDGGVASASGRY